MRRLSTLAAALACAAAAGPPPAVAQGGPSLSIALSDQAIEHGETVVASGALSPPSPGQPVELWYAAAGGRLKVAESTTDGEGRYSLGYAPPANGHLWTVAPGAAATSPAVPIGVAATLSPDGADHIVRMRVHTVSGTLRPALEGRGVRLDKLDRPGQWRTIARATTDARGDYVMRWRPVALGTFALRVVFNGDEFNGGAAPAVPGGISVYRLTHASWYGPGFFGRMTACRSRLAPHTIGVAHRRLRCGTRVRFRYRSRTLVVPVIDRGPFIAGREWDLTRAAKERLGFPGLGRIGSTR